MPSILTLKTTLRPNASEICPQYPAVMILKTPMMVANAMKYENSQRYLLRTSFTHWLGYPQPWPVQRGRADIQRVA